jgi:nucleoside 2-deoxyribosyltransferase
VKVERIYVAAPWTRRGEARAVADRLREAGYDIVSSWLTEEDSQDPDHLAIRAHIDLVDIVNSDAMVVLTLEQSEGKSVETGIAIAMGIPVIVVGPRSNIFHYLDPDLYDIRVVSNFPDALVALQEPWE